MCLRWHRDVCVVILALAASTLNAQENSKSHSASSSALALAKAARERVAASKAASTQCHVNFVEALDESTKSGKKLVVWVGVKCEQYPELRKSLNDCVHCHLTEYLGDKSARIVITDSAGNYHNLRNIDSASAAKIRRVWESVTTVRPTVDKTVSEISYVYRTQAACIV